MSGATSKAELFLLPPVATVRVVTRSDWHVGSGLGESGKINATVRRDADRLPYLPGTTLTGVLRDSCEQVAAALDGAGSGAEAAGGDGLWTAWVRCLFGHRTRDLAASEPARARVMVRAARVSAAVRAALTSVPELRAATTFIKPGVTIDRRSGRAKDHEVRFVEMARAGVTLHAPLERDGDLDGEPAAAATVLLVLGAVWLRSVGGDRRRGSGEVDVSVSAPGAPDWPTWVAACADWAAGHRPPRPPAPPAAPVALSFAEGLGGERQPLAGVSDWWEVPLTVALQERVRVSRAVLGNVTQGSDHIPGTVLLAWLLGRLGAPQTLRQALVVGDAVVTNAVPRVGGVPARRAPMALRTRKTDVGHTMHNALAAPTISGRSESGWVPASAPSGAAVLPLARTPTAFVSHNVVTVLSGRPTGDDGGLYTAEVISAGAVLCAVLRLRSGVYDRLNEEMGEGWLSTLDGPGRLGTAAKSEYGLVDVTVGPAVALPVPRAPGGSFTVWALSDVLVRDPRLRLSGRVGDVVTALGAQLGVTLDIEDDRMVVRAGRTESWQGSWRLPRPSLVGLAAGSCLRLRVTAGSVTPERLAEVLAGGLGERRGEGFGQLAIAAPLLDVLSTEYYVPTAEDGLTQRSRPPVALVTADSGDAGYLAVVRRVAFADLLAAQLRQPAATQARTPLVKALGDTTPSQRGAVRQLVTALRAPQGWHRWQTFLARRNQRRHLRALVQELSRLTGSDQPDQCDGHPLGFLVDPVRTRLGLAPDDVPAEVWRDALGLFVLDALAEVEADEVTADEATATEPRDVTEPPDATVPLNPDIDAVSTPDTELVTDVEGHQRRLALLRSGSGGRSGRGASTASAKRAAVPSRPTAYRRVHASWELTATLVARTPLHVGGAHGDPYLDLTVAVDGHGRPYVPGSSLAGVLRTWWHRCHEKAATDRLFDGLARYADPPDPLDEPMFLASLVQVADAPLHAPDGGPATLLVRDGVGIDRCTGAAALRFKYERQVASAGTQLLLRLVVEQVDGDEDVERQFRALVAELAAHGLTVGAATTRGLGRLTVAPDTLGWRRVSVSDAEGMLAAIRHRAGDNQAAGWTRVPVSDHGDRPAAGVLRVQVRWRADGPLLVGAALPGERAALMPLVDTHPDTGQPVPVLPGSSVKGALRAQVERSLRTVFGDRLMFTMDDQCIGFNTGIRELAEQVPAMGALFGSQDRRGALSVADSYATPPGATVTWTQWQDYEVGKRDSPPGDGWAREATHVAVDRWSGGAAEGLLFTVLEPHGLDWPALCLDVDLHRLIDALGPGKAKPEDAESPGSEEVELGRRRAVAAVSLLLYAVADLAAGAVPLGHGGNRGLGALAVDQVTLVLGEHTDRVYGSWAVQVPTDPQAGPAARRGEVLHLARELCRAHHVDPARWSELL